jgi:hypothetical protein
VSVGCVVIQAPRQAVYARCEHIRFDRVSPTAGR